MGGEGRVDASTDRVGPGAEREGQVHPGKHPAVAEGAEGVSPGSDPSLTPGRRPPPPRRRTVEDTETPRLQPPGVEEEIL